MDDIESPCVFYGTINALRGAQERYLNLPYPFAWYNPYDFSCKAYYLHLKDLILQQHHSHTTLSLLKADSDSFFKEYGKNDCIFVRPNDNEKSFVGTPVSRKDFDIFLRHIASYNQCPKDIEIVVAEPKLIEAEWRFVVVDKKVVGGSRYKSGPMIDHCEGYPEEAKAVAEQSAKLWPHFPVSIVDIALSGGYYWVIEIGPFNYAGLYKMNLYDVVSNINQYLKA